jgi:hypothetical protein
MSLIKFAAIYSSKGIIKSVEDQEKELAQEWIGRIERIRSLLSRHEQSLNQYMDRLLERINDEGGGNSCDIACYNEAQMIERILLNDEESQAEQNRIRRQLRGKRPITQIEDICGDFQRCNEIRHFILATGYAL